MINLPRAEDLASLDKSTGYDRRTATLGDGLVRIKPAGLNSRRRRYDLTWIALPEDDAEALEDTLESTLGTETILWTPPGETQEAKFYVESHDSAYVGASVKQVSATLVEKFL